MPEPVPISDVEIAAEAAAGPEASLPVGDPNPSQDTASLRDSLIVEETVDEGVIPDDGQSDATQTAPTQQTATTQPTGQPTSQPPASQQQPAFALSGVRETLREKYGIDPSQFQSDEAVLESFLNLRKKIGERDEYAQLGRQFAPFRDDIQDYLANRLAGLQPQYQPQAQQYQQPAQPTLEEQLAALDPPKLDQSWNRYLERDDEGGVRVKENTPLALRTKIEEGIDAYTRWREEYDRNPGEYLRKRDEIREQYILQQAEDRILQRINAQQQQAAEQQQARSFIAQHKDWMFAKNEAGQFLSDGNGQLVLAPAGQVYRAKLAQLVNKGNMSQADAAQEALEYTSLWAAAQQGQAASPQQAQQPNQQAAQPAQPAAPQLVPPTRQAVPPGAGGTGRANGNRAATTEQPVPMTAREAFFNAFDPAYSDEDAVAIVTGYQ